MFTGIVKELGMVQKLYRRGGLYRLAVSSRSIFKGVNAGDSVAVNGVCLTLVGKEKGSLSFDVTEETARRSGLANFKDGDKVNLEDSLKAGAALGGHFVLGHVDCVGKIRAVKKVGGEHIMEIEFPKGFTRLVVAKGSVALDGVSLTVGAAREESFDVYMIPHTLKATNLGHKRSGDPVNIEFDIIGKYAARLQQSGAGPAITGEFLKENGF